MRTKLYARELLEKLVTEKELRVLEAVWDTDLSLEKKIERLLE